MTVSTRANRKYVLRQRPTTRVEESTFELIEEPTPELRDGQFILRNLYLSIDPTNRIWVSDQEQYMPPVEIGHVMRGLGIGRVLESRSSLYPVGSLVSGPIGWQEFTIGSEKEAWPFSILDTSAGIPLEKFGGALGMTGMTAYFGVKKILKPKPGQTMLVSGAAGAVGSIAGQIGKIRGARIIGIAGSEEKCSWLTDELGFDKAINYKSKNWREELEKATPDGIDCNFENVGGEIMQAVLKRMNLHARMALCGMISAYNDTDDQNTRISLSPILMRRITIQGFIITDYLDKSSKAANQLAQWMSEGKIKSKETILDGLDTAPDALNKMFDGVNTGKLLIRIAQDE